MNILATSYVSTKDNVAYLACFSYIDYTFVLLFVINYFEVYSSMCERFRLYDMNSI